MLPAGLAEDCIYEYPQADWNDCPHGRNLPGERRLEAEWLQYDGSDRQGQPHAALQRSGGYLGLDPVRLRSWLRQGRGHAHFGGRRLLCPNGAFPCFRKFGPSPCRPCELVKGRVRKLLPPIRDFPDT